MFRLPCPNRDSTKCAFCVAASLEATCFLVLNALFLMAILRMMPRGLTRLDKSLAIVHSRGEAIGTREKVFYFWEA